MAFKFFATLMSEKMQVMVRSSISSPQKSIVSFKTKAYENEMFLVTASTYSAAIYFVCGKQAGCGTYRCGQNKAINKQCNSFPFHCRYIV